MELASLGLNEGETEGGRGSRSAESQNIRALCISHGSLPFEAPGTCDAPPEVHRRSVVLVGGRRDNVKDDSGCRAVFTEQGASASQVAVATVLDTISRLPDTTGDANDAVSAYSEARISDGPARLRLPKNDQRYGYDYHPGETSGRKENTYQLGNVFTFIANRHCSCPYTLTTSRWLDREKVGLVCGKSFCRRS